MDGVVTLERDGADERAALGFDAGTRVSAADVRDNIAAKHLVVQASYPGGPGYFGHAARQICIICC